MSTEHINAIAIEQAAQAWCDPETSHIQMEPALATAVSKRIAGWIDYAAQAQRNSDFYQGIVRQIGEMFGDASKTSDDGSLQDDVLALKVPELVKELLSARANQKD